MVYHYDYHHHHRRLDPSDRRCHEILWGNEDYGHFAWKYTRRVAATRHPPERRPVWYSTYKIVGYLGYVTLLVDRNRYETQQRTKTAMKSDLEPTFILPLQILLRST